MCITLTISVSINKRLTSLSLSEILSFKVLSLILPSPARTSNRRFQGLGALMHIYSYRHFWSIAQLKNRFELETCISPKNLLAYILQFQSVVHWPLYLESKVYESGSQLTTIVVLVAEVQSMAAATSQNVLEFDVGITEISGLSG
ncbi:hypothetical protein Q3G72_018693 [Acer saccharum]|nr:hypothetical protein Q3G72_018693 [Acer saccharum]